MFGLGKGEKFSNAEKILGDDGCDLILCYCEKGIKLSLLFPQLVRFIRIISLPAVSRMGFVGKVVFALAAAVELGEYGMEGVNLKFML